VDFIHNDMSHTLQRSIFLESPQDDPSCTKQQFGAGGPFGFHANLVSHQFSKPITEFFGHTFRNRRGGNSSRLGTQNVDRISITFPQSLFQQVLGTLGRLSRTRFGAQDGDGMIADCLQDLVSKGCHGQRTSNLHHFLIVGRRLTFSKGLL
jgi:hypothetical protein